MSLLAVLRAAFLVPPRGKRSFWGRPLLMWGPPGSGKTETVETLADTLNTAFLRLSPGECGEGMFGVTPVPNLAMSRLRFPPPEWVDQFTDGGLLFLDELSTSSPSLQPALLGLVQLRTIGTHRLPQRTRVIGAANEVRDAAGGWDLAPATANRFGHLAFTGYDADEWSTANLSAFAHATAAPVDLVKAEEHVLTEWPAQIAWARGLVSGFIKRRGDEALFKQPPSGSREKAWPSPRTVEYAQEALASARIQGLSEIDTDTLMAAFVGLPWVSEFRSWTAREDLPAPADVLDGKVKWHHDERRPDRTLVVLNACAALVAPADAAKRRERGRKLWSIIGAVIKVAGDVAIPAASVLIDNHVETSCPEKNDVMARAYPIFLAAGIVVEPKK